MRKKGEGEIVKEDDLWHCLFGNHKKRTQAVLEREVGRELRAQAAEARIAGEGTVGSSGASVAADVDMAGGDLVETLPIVGGSSRDGVTRF
jgi:E3 ubiquitin-protein ligase SHPRH